MGNISGMMLNIPVNSHGHVRTVSSPNHTFFLDNLDRAVYQDFVNIILLVTDNNPSRNSSREKNDCRNYFMIYLQESKGLG